MLTRLKWAIEDTIDRLNIIGRMRDAEAEAAHLAFENGTLHSSLMFGASEYGRAVEGLREISKAAAGVGTPNGTTRKIGRIADTTLSGLLTEQVAAAMNEQAVGA
jgi:hypothetical protein